VGEVTKVEAATLASAMAAAFGEIESATKSANNPHFKTKYADLTAVIEAIKPALIKHSLFFTQHPLPSEGGVTVETKLHHAGGESFSLGTLFVPANKNDAQGFGSALTYARRYALVTAFGVPVEDDDGNAAARGQSQGGAFSPSQPAEAPTKRVKLDGPYTSKTALWAAFKAFDRELRGCGDGDEFELALLTKEATELMAQCERDAPQLLEGGPDMPAEFVPLLALIEQRRAEFKREPSPADYLQAG
jgi:hypothetical protein